MELPNFDGGFSYTQKEMTELFNHIIYTCTYNILEFGSGDSTVKLHRYFSKHVEDLTYYCYESDPNYEQYHSDPNYLIENIDLVVYDINSIPSLDIPPIVFDLILIDGPNGDKRSLWYSKLRANVKKGSILLIDDFNHYTCFSEELDKNFEYELLSFSDVPFVDYGEHSWKIVRIIKPKD